MAARDLARSQIDVDAQVLHPRKRPLPGRDARAGLAKDVPANLQHEASLLGHRDEGARQQQAVRRTIPSSERLDCDHLAARKVDDGLIVDADLVALGGERQCGDKLLSVTDAKMLLRKLNDGSGALLALGGAGGDFGGHKGFGLSLIVELLCAAQGIDFRAPLTTSQPLQQVVARLRLDVATLGEDRYLAPDIEAAALLIGSGAIARATGLTQPELSA